MNAAALIDRPQEQRQLAQPGASSLISMIERVVMNPDIDVAKMERLLAMQEQVMARQAEIAFNDDLSRMQAEMPCIGERGGITDKHGKVQSTYALWEDINRMLLPVLSNHGFGLSFRISTADGVTVTAILSHRSGHKTETSMTLPVDATGGKNTVQAVASSVSYGQRGTETVVEQEQASAFISTDQATALRDDIKSAGGDEAALLKYLKFDSLEKIPAAQHARVAGLVQQKVEAAARKGAKA